MRMVKNLKMGVTWDKAFLTFTFFGFASGYTNLSPFYAILVLVLGIRALAVLQKFIELGECSWCDGKFFLKGLLMSFCYSLINDFFVDSPYHLLGNFSFVLLWVAFWQVTED